MREEFNRETECDGDKTHSCYCPIVQFSMGTQDNYETFQIFEWLDDCQTQIVCTATDEEYARFITAALNTCKEFSPCRELE